MRITVAVKEGNALTTKADVLVLKHAQALYGVDKAVFRQLRVIQDHLYSVLPQEGESLLLETYGTINASHVLFVGVPPLMFFGYQEIRKFTHLALAYLAQHMPTARHICLTPHGAGYGLDESEAFESEIAGCIDAIRNNTYPPNLERITVVERNPNRVQRLQEKLAALLPDGIISASRGQESPFQVTAKPLVFVAMPFVEKMEDVFYYGIYAPVNDTGALCERADMASFTGDVMQWVKERINNAALVIADLTMANPNVYLEVGYAWGRDKPTILLVQDAQELKFDVRGQRCLVYNTIKNLETSLRAELSNLHHVLFG